LDIVTWLVNTGGAAVNRTKAKGAIAVEQGHLATVKVLLDKGAHMNQPRLDGTTPVCIASHFGHTDTVEWLVCNGVDVNKPTNDGTTPIHTACENDHLKIVRCLFSGGAALNDIDAYGVSPAFAASRQGHVRIVRWLAGHGATVNQTTNWPGLSPLHAAAFKGKLDMVRFLMYTCGADVNLPSLTSMTPLHAAFNDSCNGVSVMESLCGKTNNSSALKLNRDLVALLLISHGAITDGVPVNEAVSSTIEHFKIGHSLIEEQTEPTLFDVHALRTLFPAMCRYYTAHSYGRGVDTRS
jgi:ankyrin repeat protein